MRVFPVVGIGAKFGSTGSEIEKEVNRLQAFRNMGCEIKVPLNDTSLKDGAECEPSEEPLGRNIGPQIRTNAWYNQKTASE